MKFDKWGEGKILLAFVFMFLIVGLNFLGVLR